MTCWVKMVVFSKLSLRSCSSEEWADKAVINFSGAFLKVALAMAFSSLVLTASATWLPAWGVPMKMMPARES